jgi:hypothetical protein
MILVTEAGQNLDSDVVYNDHDDDDDDSGIFKALRHTLNEAGAVAE